MMAEIYGMKWELPGNIPYTAGVFFRKKCITKPSPLKRILSGQEVPEEISFEQHKKEEQLNRYKNEWHKHLQRKLLEGAAKRDFNNILQNYNDNLIERREKLLALLKSEEKLYFQELQAHPPNDEDRQKNAIEKVNEFQEKKKILHDKYVEDKLNQKFWIDCDDLRQITSQQQLEAVLSDRHEQLKEKEALKELHKKEEEYFDCLWHQDYLKKVADEAQQAVERHLKNAETTAILDTQVAAKQMYLQKLEELRKEETNFLAEQRKQFDLEEQWEKDQLRKKQLETKQILDESIELYNAKCKKLKDDDEYFDSLVRQTIIDSSKVGIQERQQQKVKIQEEWRNYLHHLSAAKAEKEAVERECERIIESESLERFQKQKELHCQNEQLRQQNLKETLQVRKEQLGEKYEQLKKVQENLKFEQEIMEKEILLAKECVLEKEMEKKQIMEDYKRDLKKQIEFLEAKRLEKKQELLHELEAYRQQEENYRNKCSAMRHDSQYGSIHPMRSAARRLPEIVTNSTTTMHNINTHIKTTANYFDSRDLTLCPDYVDPSTLSLQQHKLRHMLSDKCNQRQGLYVQPNILAYHSGQD